MSICLSVYLSICPFVHLSICPSVHMSICPSVHLSICTSVHLSILADSLSICSFICLPVCSSICLSGYVKHQLKSSHRQTNDFFMEQIGFRETSPHRGDDFASPLSAFSTISFEGIFPGPSSRSRRDREENSNLSKEDFVGVILDVLKMQKNICLCRHFQVKKMSSSFPGFHIMSRVKVKNTQARFHPRLYPIQMKSYLAKI
jgi:hypothetical protein